MKTGLRMDPATYEADQAKFARPAVAAPSLREEIGTAPKRNKIGNIPTVVQGITFHSKREAARFLVLQAREKVGEIRDLKRQVKYELIPRLNDWDGRCLFGRQLGRLILCTSKAMKP